MELADAIKYHRQVEVIHAYTYFVPETFEVMEKLGLKSGMMPYFASRAAPMGAVSAGVVTATFYNFSPTQVVRSIPLAWSLASPSDIVAARIEAVSVSLRRLIGDEADSPDIAEAAAIVREATEVCSSEGRPLFAAHAELEWPGEPLVDLWHGVTLLREHRGDGHIAVLVGANLSGIEALITHDATGNGFTPDFAKWTRGWTEQQWVEAQQSLRERDILDEEGKLSENGQALRDQIEEETNLSAVAPWKHIGDEKAQRLAAIGLGVSRRIVGSSAIPDGLFTDLSVYVG